MKIYMQVLFYNDGDNYSYSSSNNNKYDTKED